MLSDFVLGFSRAWSALGDLATPGLRRFVAMPALTGALVFAGLAYFAFAMFERLMARLLSLLPGWLDWLQWLLWPVFALVVLLATVYTFTLLANLIASPFNGLLAEKFEAMLAGSAPRSPDRGLAASLAAAPLHEVRKLWYMIRWLVPAAVMFLIPGLNLLAPAVWLTLGAWLLALEYMDYPMDNHGIAFRDQRGRLASRRGLALGFGAGMLLMTSIPLLNFLAMPAGVLAATRIWCRDLRGRPESARPSVARP